MTQAIAAQLAPLALRACKDRLLLLVRSADVLAAIQHLGLVFRGAGYQQEEQSPVHLLYGRGSKAGKFLFGGLSDRQAFRVRIEPDGGVTLLTVEGTASVLTSGALGISKMRKELARLGGLIMNRFTTGTLPPGMPAEAYGRFAAVMTGPEEGRGVEYASVILVIVAIVVGVMIAAFAVAMAVPK